MVLDHVMTAGREGPHGEGLKKHGVGERGSERRVHWIKLSVRVIAKTKDVGRR